MSNAVRAHPQSVLSEVITRLSFSSFFLFLFIFFLVFCWFFFLKFLRAGPGYGRGDGVVATLPEDLKSS